MITHQCLTKLSLAILIVILLPCHAFAYGFNAHRHIAQQALTFAAQKTPALQDEFNQRSPEILDYSTRADLQNYTDLPCLTDPLKGIGVWDWCDEPGLVWRDHFWDPDDNTNLINSFGLTALEKAQDYWGRAQVAYVSGDKVLAFQLLGAIAHLLSDMALPAHVHNDGH